MKSSRSVSSAYATEPNTVAASHNNNMLSDSTQSKPIHAWSDANELQLNNKRASSHKLNDTNRNQPPFGVERNTNKQQSIIFTVPIVRHSSNASTSVPNTSEFIDSATTVSCRTCSALLLAAHQVEEQSKPQQTNRIRQEEAKAAAASTSSDANTSLSPRVAALHALSTNESDYIATIIQHYCRVAIETFVGAWPQCEEWQRQRDLPASMTPAITQASAPMYHLQFSLLGMMQECQQKLSSLAQCIMICGASLLCIGTNLCELFVTLEFSRHHSRQYVVDWMQTHLCLMSSSVQITQWTRAMDVDAFAALEMRLMHLRLRCALFVALLLCPIEQLNALLSESNSNKVNAQRPKTANPHQMSQQTVDAAQQLFQQHCAALVRADSVSLVDSPFAHFLSLPKLQLSGSKNENKSSKSQVQTCSQAALSELTAATEWSQLLHCSTLPVWSAVAGSHAQLCKMIRKRHELTAEDWPELSPAETASASSLRAKLCAN